MNNGPLSNFFYSASFAGLLSFFNHFYSICGHLFTSLKFISSCVAAEAPDRVAVAWSCSQTLLIRSDTGEDGQKDGRTHFAETEIKIDWRSEEQKQWHTVPLTQTETTLFNIFNNHACSSTHLSHVSCRHGDVFMHAFIIHRYTWEVKIMCVSNTFSKCHVIWFQPLCLLTGEWSNLLSVWFNRGYEPLTLSRTL